MTGTVIVLIVIGLIFIFVSFFISEAMNDSVEEEKQDVVANVDVTLSNEQLTHVQQQIEDAITEYCENILYQTENQLATMSNEKTLALGDYAVSVCEEIEKNHKEEMFLYSMLGEKEKELKLLVQQVDELRKDLRDTLMQSNKIMEEATVAAQMVQAAQTTQTTTKVSQDTHVTKTEKEEDAFDSVLQEIDAMDIDFSETDVQTPTAENANEIILELKKSGMSIIEIAKQLGLGVGEVKLVVDLYQGV